MQLKEVLRKDVIDMVLATDMKQVGGREGEGGGCAVMLFPRYLPKFLIQHGYLRHVCATSGQLAA